LQEGGHIAVTVLLPTYDEADNIHGLTESIVAELPHGAELIVIDDNSPDYTWRVADELRQTVPCLRVLRRTCRRGVASAIADGYSVSRGEAVIWMDADCSHPPTLIRPLLKSLLNHDVAVASRYVDGGGDARPLLRSAASRILNMIAYYLLGTVRDYTSGYVAVRRNVLDHVKIAQNLPHGAYFIDWLYRVVKCGYSVTEVGYVNTDRIAGKSKVSGGVRTFLVYLKTIFATRFSC